VVWLVTLVVWIVLGAVGRHPSTALLILWIPVAALVLLLALFWWRWEKHVPDDRGSW
jgi:hypothetical protein